MVMIRDWKDAVCLSYIASVLIFGVFFWDDIAVDNGWMQRPDDYPMEVAEKMRIIAGINHTVELTVKDFNYCDFKYAQSYCNESNPYCPNCSLILGYANSENITIKPEAKNEEWLIAHEMAHVKLFSEGNFEDHHGTEQFNCWTTCLKESYNIGIDLCGGCRT